MKSTNKPFVMPTLELISLRMEDVITASGGFSGDWDENMPHGIDLPGVGE